MDVAKRTTGEVGGPRSLVMSERGLHGGNTPVVRYFRKKSFGYLKPKCLGLGFLADLFLQTYFTL